MIVEKRQFGCVQILLVQIGLVVYLIVVFLTQTADGIVPQVLRVQKVAESGQSINLDQLGIPAPQALPDGHKPNTETHYALTLNSDYTLDDVLAILQPLHTQNPNPFLLDGPLVDKDILAHNNNLESAKKHLSDPISITGTRPRAPTLSTFQA